LKSESPLHSGVVQARTLGSDREGAGSSPAPGLSEGSLYVERNQQGESLGINPGYAHWQLAKALTTSEEHADPATRERARQRVVTWAKVLEGLIDGSVGTGSRTPISGVPAWATLEVVTGGFATGTLLAGGQLLDHELRLLAELSLPQDGRERRALNLFYLTDEGLSRLRSALASGCYEIDVPEEGMLLVVAWLLDHGQPDLARTLLEEIGPFLSKLRFYPRPVDRPQRFGAQVFVQDVAATIDSLGKIQPNLRILAQKEAIEVWAPLYDKVVDLFLETLDGDPPTLMTDEAAEPSSAAVVGGWPCQVYPDDWAQRGKQLLGEYASKRRVHQLCGKPERKHENFFQLRQYLDRCVQRKNSVSRRDIDRIRQLLARYVTRRGIPSSAGCAAIRERQSQQACGPTLHQVSQVVAARLAQFQRERGIDDLEPVVRPITAAEAHQHKLPGPAEIPASIARKVERCLCETADELIRRGIITSGDTLARVLPQFTSGLRAAGIDDPALRQLYSAIYRAFRRRRSLLLLDLESQVKIDELPWVAAIDNFRRRDLTAREVAREALREIAVLTLVSFPQAILPNKLLQELRELAKQAHLALPLVEELAADIFMGRFGKKFEAAAQQAGKLLANTLYATYYDVDYAMLECLPPRQPPTAKAWLRGYMAETEDPFTALCRTRAAITSGWDVAVNGMIIEQQQILTTQNLAVLVSGLELVPELRDHFSELARRCFDWICKQQQINPPTWHALLINLKNTAYAWRQMVFFLSLSPASEVDQFLAWADEHLSRQRTDFQTRFRPAVEGLRRAAAGMSPEDGISARRFVGWTKERHWLLGPKPPA
jgi:hypothetical protein